MTITETLILLSITSLALLPVVCTFATGSLSGNLEVSRRLTNASARL